MNHAFLLVLLAGTCPHGCLCARDATDLAAVVLAAVDEAAAVFAGRVESVRRIESHGEIDDGVEVSEWLEANILVESSWKGDPSDRVRVRTPWHAALCGFPFEAGRRYLVYTSAATDGTLTTHACMRTRSADRAAQEIAVLRRVVGRVVPVP